MRRYIDFHNKNQIIISKEKLWKWHCKTYKLHWKGGYFFWKAKNVKHDCSFSEFALWTGKLIQTCVIGKCNWAINVRMKTKSIMVEHKQEEKTKAWKYITPHLLVNLNIARKYIINDLKQLQELLLHQAIILKAFW